MKFKYIHLGVKLACCLSTNIDGVENFLHLGFHQSSLWCSLGIINANIPRSFSDYSSTPIERNSILYGSANWLWEFALWQTVELPVIWDVITSMQRHCNEMDILSLWHKYDLFQKSQSSIYCPFLGGIHWWLVDSLHKWRVMRKVLPCRHYKNIERHAIQTIVSKPNH